jgi:hypothetical protein
MIRTPAHMPPATATPSSGRYYPARLTLRVPRGLPQAIDAAARRGLTSPSEYVRRAVLNALKADGLDLGTDVNLPVGQSVQKQAA